MVRFMENPAVRLMARFGRSRAAAAAHFGISLEAIRLWLENGIPSGRALEVEEATRGSKFQVKAVDVLRYARQQRKAA